MYSLLRDLLFKLEAEQAHYFSMNLLRTACGIGLVRKIISSLFTPHNPSLERQVFGLLAKGYSNTELVEELGVALSTVKEYKSEVMYKLRLRSLSELIALNNNT